MDIDLLLYKLVKKYDIYRSIPEAEASYSKQLSWQLLNEKIENIAENKVIALRGGGVYAQMFCKNLSEEAKRKIKYVIDCNVSIKIDGLKTIHPSQLERKKVDVVIISSWNMKAEFVRELLDSGKKLEIIEPYDYLESYGIHFSQEIFAKDKSLHITYLDINNTLGLYEIEENSVQKKYFLEKLIAQLIEIKDFISAEEYICQYISNGWDVNQQYFNFKKDLCNLWEQIKNISLQRQKKDIFINWVDNVNAEECYKVQFFKQRIEDSCVFKKAYTVTPWTHFAIDTLFTGKLPIEDKTYLMTKINESNSQILKTLKDTGHQFEYIANPTMYQRMFETNIMQLYPDSFGKIVLNDRSVSECSTRLQWISLRVTLMSEKPVCHLIHNFSETHRPVIYTGISTMSGDRASYIEEGLHFLAEQLEWYSQFYGRNSYQIYLSDHGDELLYERAYENGRTNVMFILKGPGIKCGEEQRLYSHQNFDSIIKAIATENVEEWEKCFRESIIYENADLYHYNNILIHIVEQWLSGKQPHIMGVYQLRGVRTAEDLYIKYAIGKELYYRLPDEESNLIEDDIWKERIDYLKKICGDKFIDISEEPLFEKTRLIYDYLKSLPQEEIRW